jgi:hypothetical protein
MFGTVLILLSVLKEDFRLGVRHRIQIHVLTWKYKSMLITVQECEDVKVSFNRWVSVVFPLQVALQKIKESEKLKASGKRK